MALRKRGVTGVWNRSTTSHALDNLFGKNLSVSRYYTQWMYTRRKFCSTKYKGDLPSLESYVSENKEDEGMWRYMLRPKTSSWISDLFRNLRRYTVFSVSVIWFTSGRLD